MRKEFKKSIKEAKKLIYKIEDTGHDYIHIKSVLKTALKITKQYPKINEDIIKLAVWWHDVGRVYDDDNTTHQKISAEITYKALKKLNIEEDICKQVFDAIIFHGYSQNPQTLEGEIIRDADKLDFISIQRWKHCLKTKNFERLKDITEKLLKLESIFLHLEISKKIYNKKIKKFIKFVKSIRNKDFEEIKNRILSYNL